MLGLEGMKVVWACASMRHSCQLPSPPKSVHIALLRAPAQFSDHFAIISLCACLSLCFSLSLSLSLSLCFSLRLSLLPSPVSPSPVSPVFPSPPLPLPTLSPIIMAVDLEDSNMALFGSDLEREVKKRSAESEREYKGAGSKVGIEIWRVEKFAIKRWPKNRYGEFFEGDSYIVLKTYKKGDSQKLHYNAHFWLGKHTTQDEAGTAAYKTVELDTLLDDVPVQFREVQGHESRLFQSYFAGKFGLVYLKGGIESGFNHIEPTTYNARLLQFKGKRTIRITEVPMQRDSLNAGDVFMLDDGFKIFVWHGSKSGVFERRKADELMQHLKGDRGVNCEAEVLSETERNAEFWEKLGGFGQVKPAEEGGDDREAEAKANHFRLYRISDKTGMKLEQEGELSKNMLDSNDVFLVDRAFEIYLWVGQGASRTERSKALSYGMSYLHKEGKPMHTPIVRYIQGGETDEFNQCFPKGGHPIATNIGNAESGCCLMM
jgi:gelsolin